MILWLYQKEAGIDQLTGRTYSLQQLGNLWMAANGDFKGGMHTHVESDTDYEQYRLHNVKSLAYNRFGVARRPTKPIVGSIRLPDTGWK